VGAMDPTKTLVRAKVNVGELAPIESWIPQQLTEKMNLERFRKKYKDVPFHVREKQRH